MIDINNGKVVSTFNGGGDNGFENPHDIAVSEDGSVLYEVELRPFKVWKLTNGENGGVKQPEPEPGVFSWLTGAISSIG